MTGQLLGKGPAQTIPPEGVEGLAAPGAQGRAHLQPVGLDAIHRLQHAVETREDPDMVLGPGQGLRVQLPGLQAGIDVAVEGEGRL